jgi:hypothetical protein
VGCGGGGGGGSRWFRRPHLSPLVLWLPPLPGLAVPVRMGIDEGRFCARDPHYVCIYKLGFRWTCLNFFLGGVESNREGTFCGSHLFRAEQGAIILICGTWNGWGFMCHLSNFRMMDMYLSVDKVKWCLNLSKLERSMFSLSRKECPLWLLLSQTI